AAPGVFPTVTIKDANANTVTPSSNTCAANGTDSNGQCTVTFTSTAPGTFTAHATAVVNVQGTNFPVATGDGQNGDSPDATKTYVDANIQLSPLTATNEVGTPHTFTAHVNVNTGTGGFVNAPAGTTVGFTVVSGPGSVSPASCTTVGAS